MHDKWESKKRVSFKPKNYVSTSKPLELLDIDLFVPSRTKILGGGYYDFVIVNHYTIFTWTLFLSHREETFKDFVKFVKLVQNQINLKFFITKVV